VGDKMTLRAGMCVLALCFTATPLLADEVLYCTDTDATGFKWDKNGAAAHLMFVEERFTVKIISEDQRLITPSIGDTAGRGEGYQCSRPLPHALSDRIECHDPTGGEVWVFFKNTYTRAFLAGPPAGGSDQNIWMAYGTCTKF
jgi:hypothetical protein